MLILIVGMYRRAKGTNNSREVGSRTLAAAQNQLLIGAIFVNQILKPGVHFERGVIAGR